MYQYCIYPIPDQCWAALRAGLCGAARACGGSCARPPAGDRRAARSRESPGPSLVRMPADDDGPSPAGAGPALPFAANAPSIPVPSVVPGEWLGPRAASAACAMRSLLPHISVAAAWVPVD